MRKTIIEIVLAGIIIISAVFGAITYFATASEVAMVSQRLDQKILSDRIAQIRQMMWMLEDRNGSKNVSTWYSREDKETYRKLQLQLDLLLKQYNALIKN